ncbi:nucleolin-like protein, partial [Trichonephila clavata]
EIEIKTLYVGNLSTDVTPDDLKALSPDITEVFAQKNSKSPRRYAFIRFASEEKAVANHKALQGKKLNGQVLKICFTGEKANVYSPKNKCALNVKELFISGLPPSATIGDVAIHFPKANVVRMIRSTAKVSFEKEEDANEAYNLKEIEIHGCKLLIYHAKLDNASQINKGKYFRNYKKFEPSVKFPSYSGISKVGQKFEKYNPSKKMKFFKNG